MPCVCPVAPGSSRQQSCHWPVARVSAIVSGASPPEVDTHLKEGHDPPKAQVHPARAGDRGRRSAALIWRAAHHPDGRELS